MKVKGDLILISSDIKHSLTKILPIEQSLIPVRFKRKMAYSGAFIEEFIEKVKVKMYYTWLKRHNHLYKDVTLDETLIEQFESESISVEEEIDQAFKQQGDEKSCCEDEDVSVDFLEDYFDQEAFEPVQSPQSMSVGSCC